MHRWPSGTKTTDPSMVPSRADMAEGGCPPLSQAPEHVCETTLSLIEAGVPMTTPHDFES